MSTENAVKGSVVEILSGGLYKVQIVDKEYICYIAGKMKINHIRVILGDEVEVILDPYKGKTTNRIVSRVPIKPL